MKSASPAWETIHKDPREIMRWESACNVAIANCDRAMRALNVALVMLHGGHVARGALAMAGNMVADWEPAQVVEHVRTLLAKEFQPLKG
jgi:hypothetical protein